VLSHLVHDLQGAQDEIMAAVQDPDGDLWICGRGDPGPSTYRAWLGRIDPSLSAGPHESLTLDHQHCYDIEFLAFDSVVAVGDDYDLGGGAWTYVFPPWDPDNGTTTSETTGVQTDAWLAAVRSNRGGVLVGGKIGDQGVVAPLTAEAPGDDLTTTRGLGSVQALVADRSGFIAAGLETTVDLAGAWVTARTPEGTERWTWRPDPPIPLGDEIEAVAITGTGAVIAVGFAQLDTRQRWVVEIDPAGELVWSVTLPGYAPVGEDVVRDVVVLPGDDFVVVGEVQDEAGELQPWIARMTP
jgi:hypothetical protein